MRLERVATGSDDILAYRAGNLRAALLAGVCCAAGVGLLKVATMLTRLQSSVVGLLILLATGLIVIGAASLVRALRRRGVILDRAVGVATAWHAAFVRRSTTSRELGAFWTVLLSPGRVQERYASRTVYLVGLRGEIGEPLLLHWDVDYEASRRFGVEAAEFLQFPFTDAAGTDTVIHPPGKATVLPPGQPPAVRSVPRPAALRCGVGWHGPTLVIEEPRVGWREHLGGPLLLFLLLAPAFLAIGAYARFFTQAPGMFLDPLIASIVVVGMLLLMLVAIVFSSLPQLAQRRIVEADADGLRFRTEGLFASKDRHLRRGDIRELRIAFGHLGAVTPRDYRLICGRLHGALARAELEWLRDQLTQALRGASGVG
jgi:hypothetical protein